MGNTNETIKEWIGKILGILFFGCLACYSFFSTCVGKVDTNGQGTNYQECQMLRNENSHVVARECLPNAKPSRERAGGVVYRETYEDEDEALDVFWNIIEKIGKHHAGGKVKTNYGHRDEMYFVCYGEGQSIIATYREYKKFYAVSIQYVDTEKYDWDYLSSRIKN